MATRKAITLVSGLFQEVNTPTDKLDFAGNTTADLTENTNLYYTDARSRAAVSVTDSGGDGSLAYNNSTGVITYTGPSDSDVRGTLSVASGSGLTYNSGTGEFGTSAIPNGQLANSSVTIGGTAIALGGTATTISGLTSLVSDTISSFTEGQTNSITLGSGNITFEGSTADANETILTAADASGGDKTLTLPNETGTILTTASSIANSNLANSAVTIGGTSVSLGATASTITGITSLASTTLISGAADGANSITLASGNITFEGSTADANEIILTAVDASGSDKTITLPNATGTVALLSTLSIASGSGLTYNSGTGEFSTNAIPNAQLANSSVTVGSTAIALGNSSTTLTGLSSVTSTAVVTNDSGFRIRNNSDNTKIGAFSSASITGGQTRTLTFPDADGTIATQSYVNSQISAEDLDVETDSGNFDVDLNSEALTIAGGTGIDSSGSGTTATIAIDSTVATKTGSATLTNKTVALGSNTVSGTLAQFNTAVTDATLVSTTGSETLTNKTLTSPVLNSTISGTSIKDEDDMASDSASHLATQQSIKAFSSNASNITSGTLAAARVATLNQDTTGTAAIATTVTVADESSDTSCNVLFTTAATGDLAPKSGTNLTFNSSSGVLTATGFAGALTGNVTGNASGSSGSCTGNAATATALANARTIAGVSFDGTANISLNNNAITNGAGYISSSEFADDVFRVKDNSDASKKVAFECSGISGSTTRTMTVPDANGTISTESFATAIAVALG